MEKLMKKNLIAKFTISLVTLMTGVVLSTALNAQDAGQPPGTEPAAGRGHGPGR